MSEAKHDEAGILLSYYDLNSHVAGDYDSRYRVMSLWSEIKLSFLRLTINPRINI